VYVRTQASRLCTFCFSSLSFYSDFNDIKTENKTKLFFSLRKINGGLLTSTIRSVFGFLYSLYEPTSNSNFAEEALFSFRKEAEFDFLIWRRAESSSSLNRLQHDCK
jgi:hypothetical protein